MKLKAIWSRKMLSIVLCIGLLVFAGAGFWYFKQQLTLEQQAGQLFMLGFTGKQPDYYIKKALSLRNFGGVILFGQNIGDDQQVKELTQSLTLLPRTKPFIAIDQEGGSVVRIQSDPTVHTSQKDIETVDKAYAVAKQRAEYLRGLGITMNLAPVVDVSTDEHAGIFPRTFRKEWGSFGDAMVRGYTDGHVFPVVKHFPSYGNFSGDVEGEIPVKELSEEEKQAFSVSLQHADFLMISPVIIANIDPEKPAPLSTKVINYVRNDLHFSGVIITDDVEMQAIQKKYDVSTFALDAIKAGVDMVLFSGNPEDAAKTYDLLLERVRSGEIPKQQFEMTMQKILRMKSKL